MSARKQYEVEPTGQVPLKVGLSSPADAAPTRVDQVFAATAKKYGARPALHVKRAEAGQDAASATWKSWTWAQYYDDCKTAAKSFIALGLEPSHSVAILAFNSPEWFIADIGAVFAGGMAAGIYITNKPDACLYTINHSRAQVVLVDTPDQLKKILSIRGEMKYVKKIVQMLGEPSPEAREAGVLSWLEFMTAGSQVPDYELRARMDAQLPGNCCTLIYTSGTTGPPKAVMISHDNITWTSGITDQFLKLTPKDHIISYLPLSHIAAQMVDLHGPMRFGSSVWFAQPDALKSSLGITLKEVRPTIFLGVPRVWEKIEEKMRAAGAQATGLKLKIATWAKAKGAAASEAIQAGRSTPFGFGLANALVYKKVRKAIGLDRCRAQFTAAAPIDLKTLKYFASLNIHIYEVYGMSECTGPQTVSGPGHLKLGAAGVAIPGSEMKIAEKTGEICYRGRHVFMGYMFQEEKTKEAIDADGWLHSGDIGEIDERGFLHITGRIKELLITAGGENVAPVPIEENIKTALPAISNAMAIGDRRKFLSVLLSWKVEMDPNTAAPTDKLTAGAKAWLMEKCQCSAETAAEASANPAVLKAIQEGIDAANRQAVSNAARITKFAMLPADFSIPGGELGPTMKLKRPDVVAKYSELIESLYAGGEQ